MEDVEILVLKKDCLDIVKEKYPFIKEEMEELAEQRYLKFSNAINVAKRVNFQIGHTKMGLLKGVSDNFAHHDFSVL